VNSARGENMMSALHQTLSNIPRYRRDRVGSGNELQASSRENKVLLRSQLTILCRGLLVLVSAPGALGAWGKYDECSASTTPRHSEVPS